MTSLTVSYFAILAALVICLLHFQKQKQAFSFDGFSVNSSISRLLPLDLQFFAGDGGGAGGDGGDGGDGGQGGDGNPDGGGDPTPKTFTEEDIESARTTALNKAKEDLYKQLGVKNLNELQAKLKASESKEQADETLKAQIEEKDNEINVLKTSLKFSRAVAKYYPQDEELVLTAVTPLLQKDPDTGEVTNMEEAIKKIKAEKPFLFKADSKPGSTEPGGGDPPASKKGKDLGASIAERRNKRFS